MVNAIYRPKIAFSILIFFFEVFNVVSYMFLPNVLLYYIFRSIPVQKFGGVVNA